MNTSLVIAANTISEAMRRKILNAFLMVVSRSSSFMFAFSTFSARQELTLIKGMGLGIITLAGLYYLGDPVDLPDSDRVERRRFTRSFPSR
jgi:hypothetical protein